MKGQALLKQNTFRSGYLFSQKRLDLRFSWIHDRVGGQKFPNFGQMQA